MSDLKPLEELETLMAGNILDVYEAQFRVQVSAEQVCLVLHRFRKVLTPITKVRRGGRDMGAELGLADTEGDELFEVGDAAESQVRRLLILTSILGQNAPRQHLLQPCQTTTVNQRRTMPMSCLLLHTNACPSTRVLFGRTCTSP